MEMLDKQDLEQIANLMKVIVENEVKPSFNLLAEKLDLLEQKMVPVETMEDAEDRMDILEATVRHHSREIEKLKKAQ